MEIIEALKEMQDKILEIGKTPILFVGAGLSQRYYGTPRWRELLEMVAEKIEIDKDTIERWESISNEDLATELEYHCFAKERPEYSNGEDRRYPLRKIIKQIIEEKNVVKEEKENELEELSNIMPTAIVTTNYDQLLENTFGNTYDVCVGQDIIFSDKDNHSKTIYKIHGSVSASSSIVITQEDYDRFMVSSKYLYAKLMTLFWENPIVFMGYSVSDGNVKKVLDTILEIMTIKQKEDFEQRVWMLAYADGKEELFDNVDISTGKNTIKIKRFCLDKSYSQFYKALSVATRNIQEKDLKFTISENAIDLLIKPLYQNQDKFKVVVRELLQNAMDACKKADKSIKVTIGVIIEDDNVKLRVADCGIGMDFNDITNYFLTIGKSSKNEEDNGLTGKFGIGILSIFLIGKEAKVYSQKEASMPIGIRIFQNNSEKKVEKIDVNKDVIESDFSIILEINIDDAQIAKKLIDVRKIEEVIQVLGLDNYCVWDDAEITIAFNKTEDAKPLEKLDLNGMTRINDVLYIEEIYTDEKRQKHSKGTALINDMITRITFGTTMNNSLENVGIPFFATRTRKDLYAENVKPNLSRSEVEIEGKLREDIISHIYEEEVNKLISGVKEQLKVGKISALDLRDNVISNCKLLKNQKVVYKKDAIIIPKGVKSFIQIYGSREIFEKIVDEKCCDYCSAEINKAELGDMIDYGNIKGIGIAHLYRYICNATGSYNGFRMQVIKKLFALLGIKGVPYDNATNMWAVILQNKDNLKKIFEGKAQDGIIWFEKDYQSIVGKGIFNNLVIAEEYKYCFDKKFIEILESKLNCEPDIKRYLLVE